MNEKPSQYYEKLRFRKNTFKIVFSLLRINESLLKNYNITFSKHIYHRYSQKEKIV